MTRVRACLLALCMVQPVAALAASLTLEPVPETANQSARLGSAFALPPGVTVRDEGGNPVAGVTVTFTAGVKLVGGGAFIDRSDFYDASTGVSGPDGRAFASLPLVAYSLPVAGTPRDGTVRVVAGAADAPIAATFDYRALLGSATRLVPISGSGQRAFVGTAYRDPLVMQASDDDGSPMPYAVVRFGSNVAGDAGVIFDGLPYEYAIADANGVVTSPPLTADDSPGSFLYYPQLFAAKRLTGFFSLTNLDGPALAATFVDPVAGNAPYAEPGFAPLVARVVDASGQPAAGVAYLYRSECLIFNGDSAESAGVTDAAGIAVSTWFVGAVENADCPVMLTVDRVLDPITTSIYVFTFDSLALSTSVSSMQLATSSQASFDFTLTSFGRPVFYPATASATTFATGATASIDQVEQQSGSGRVSFSTNSRPGKYDIVVAVPTTAGTLSANVAVKQLPHH